VLGAASAVPAQEAPAGQTWGRAGIGVAFLATGPIGQLTGTSTAYIPVPVSPTLRLEPAVGWNHTSFTDTTNVATDPRNGLSESGSTFLLAVGLFRTTRPGNGNTLLYYGPRVGLAWGSATIADASGADSLSATQTSWFASAVLGGEHRIAHLSVGGEVGLSYQHNGAPSFQQRGSGFTVALTSGTMIGSSAAAFLRWYF
jgi:hypothetical protein